ncbi:Crp/Fnr family transcriptional regulator [Rubrimonas cliftonensis]|uniref:cAMP-binding domain of CRP or a regulatory subunit of cAMP-dependent protein kinases n=1 Tax=Rubrimonas cliftonensis TaxID=89524 RepID=A0A1H4FVA2_9RHOB|nr:Crp/Fnr family transcriptional regulator [Rubrimonas cliftonensis]SEB00578.1 cAMP-binding domain of CRP or a regulatory subunit of cAMP-dependent protein kinases [Rubrimonas cliftonensis]
MTSTFNNYAAGVMDLLPQDARDAVLASGTRMRLKNKQLVQSRGHRSIGLGIILKGRIRLMTIGVDGTMHLTAILGPGQQFNEVTLFANARRTHDAEAVGETEILTLTAAEYERLSKQHPVLVEALLISNVQRVHQLVEILNDLRAQTKLVALARVLLKNAWHARGDSQKNSLELDIAQEDIAMFLGVTRPYLNQKLGQLCALGFIELSYRKIRVVDLARLSSWIQDQLTYDAVEECDYVLIKEEGRALSDAQRWQSEV